MPLPNIYPKNRPNMAGFWPLYSDFSSKAQVTLALPPMPSKICEAIGVTASALLLVPNIDFLIRFIEGDIGIADKMAKSALSKALSSPIAQSSEGVIRQMSKVKGLGLEDKIQQFKGPDGKIKIPASEIRPPAGEDLGLKALEKAVLTSIFETQKPYLEIAKLVIGVLVDIEDIIARVMPLLSISPLTFKSDKPVGNAGSGKRQKALGYQNGKEVKAALAALDRVVKKGGKLGNPKDEGKSPLDPNAANAPKAMEEGGKKWEIVSAVYSTGDFDPKVDYIYTYNDLPALPDPNAQDEPEEEDPYDKYKPDRIILGIYDSKGAPLNPSDFLWATNDQYNPNSPGDMAGMSKTPFRKADWILKSPKWVFPKSQAPNATTWPTLAAPVYRWKGTGAAIGQNRESKEKPGDITVLGVKGDWEIKKYKKDQKNEISGVDAIEGDPVIVGFDPLDISAYTSYFTEYTRINMALAEGIDEKEKADSVKQILSQLDVKAHLENVTQYGQGKTSVYKGFSIPEGMRPSFKPMKITVEEAKADPKLAGTNGEIWIDPESDYEMKIIEVKPTSRVSYSGAKGEPKVDVQIRSFIKNRTVISMKGGEKFNIDVKRNGAKLESVQGVSEWSLENWNYDPSDKSVSSSSSYQIDIWSENPGGKIGKMLAAAPSVVMGRGTSMKKHGDYEISISKKDGKWAYEEREYSIQYSATGEVPSSTASVPRKFSDGSKKLGDGTVAIVKSGFVEKWVYVGSLKLDKGELPSTGKEISMQFDLSSLKEAPAIGGISLGTAEPAMSSSSKAIPLYQISARSADSKGIVIDPSKIDNEQLYGPELYSDGRYGAGGAEDPQELGTVYRHPKTELDTETYYIIEGVKPELNTGGFESGSNAAGGAGGGKYRLPHAIGAVPVFIKALVKIFSKLIPSIKTLLKLFGNPMGFVTDVVMKKLGESFSVFSPEALKRFGEAGDLLKKRKEYQKPKTPDSPNAPNMGDYVRKMRGLFQESPLLMHVAVDSLGDFKDASGKPPKGPAADSIGNFKFVADGVGFIPFSIFGKDLSFGMELKMANVLTKEWGNALPMRLIFDKEKNSPDGLGIKQAGGASSSGDGAGAAGAGAAGSGVDTDPSRNGKAAGKAMQQGDKRWVIVSEWYSTGEFKKGVDYKYIYIDQEDQSLLAEADKLADSVDPADVEKAQRMLEDALAKDPEDEALKSKLEDIMKKRNFMNSNTQPLLKFILGIVTLPIKVIAGIVEYIMNFFKGLTNPVTLPAKIVQFLSFKWMMDFFSPKGLMKMAGINFDFAKVPEWMSQAMMPNPLKGLSPEELAKHAPLKSDAMGKKDGKSAAKEKSEKKAKPDAKPEEEKAKRAEEGKAKLKKESKPHGGSYALADDFGLGNLPEFLDIAFLARLPVYSARDMREQGPNITKRLSLPIFCFIEKLINGFIDFVWSTLGIEPIMPPPHIKLCKSGNPDSMDEDEKKKLLDGEDPANAAAGTGGVGGAGESPATTEVLGTEPFMSQNPPLPSFVYEVKMPDGSVKTFLDKESLDSFMEENRQIGFDVQF